MYAKLTWAPKFPHSSGLKLEFCRGEAISESFEKGTKQGCFISREIYLFPGRWEILGNTEKYWEIPGNTKFQIMDF